MGSFVEGFHRGRLLKQQQEQLARQEEAHKLNIELHKHQLNQAKLQAKLEPFRQQIELARQGVLPTTETISPGTAIPPEAEAQPGAAFPVLTQTLPQFQGPIPSAPQQVEGAPGLMRPAARLGAGLPEGATPALTRGVKIQRPEELGGGELDLEQLFRDQAQRALAQQRAQLQLKQEFEPPQVTGVAAGAQPFVGGKPLGGPVPTPARPDTSLSVPELALKAAQGDKVAQQALELISRTSKESKVVINPFTKPLTKTQIFQQERQLRGELRGVLKDWKIPELQTAAKSIEVFANHAIQEGSGAATDAVIVAFNKMIDAGSVVRESEFARTLEIGSLTDRLQGRLTRFTKGQRVTPDVIRDMRDTALALNKEISKARQAAEGHYAALAAESGISPKNVVGFSGGFAMEPEKKKFQAGDVISYKGRQRKIKAINPDGGLVLEPLGTP